ncbi:MAG: hypothetical protein HQL47_07825 [Gammaproteobacteria bacterium]|nr:hypothetical protein [Gammaproteobacteria bacterium]
MEAIRTIQSVDQGEIHLTLPESFWGKEVEVIVLARECAQPQVAKEHPSRRGALKHYANPERRDAEATAWSEAMRDKHEPG